VHVKGKGVSSPVRKAEKGTVGMKRTKRTKRELAVSEALGHAHHGDKFPATEYEI